MRKPKSGGQSLTREELIRLLKAAKARRERDYIAILVTFWHGLRASELCSLVPENFEGQRLTIRRLKHSLETSQPLVDNSDPLLDERGALASYLPSFQPRERLFPISRVQFYRLVKRYAGLAGLPPAKRHPHMLKHSIAMAIRKEGVEFIQQRLGHKSGASTLRYLRVTDDEAAEAVTRAEQKRAAIESDQLGLAEGLTVRESLRQALRLLEQAEERRQGRTRRRRP